jgi:hypothetical protein
MMNDADALIPDPKVAKRYNVCNRTIARWDSNSKLGFPKPFWINNRRYRRLLELQEWERARAAGKGPEAV